jgi:hypothetical protein
MGVSVPSEYEAILGRAESLPASAASGTAFQFRVLPRIRFSLLSPFSAWQNHTPALHVLRSLKLPSVALYLVESTFQRGFDSFRAHHSFQELGSASFHPAIPGVAVFEAVA